MDVSAELGVIVETVLELFPSVAMALKSRDIRDCDRWQEKRKKALDVVVGDRLGRL